MTTRKQLTVRASTGDRGPPDGSVVIHTVEQLGPNTSLLPNGSLLCKNVPLARLGWMMYGPGETPIAPPKGGGVAYVQRTEKELFSDKTLASFVGAAVVDEHPDDDVTPQNWKVLAKGIVLTARRGTGADSDLVLGDLLITEAGLIASIQAGKREVSAGYDADYEQISDGVGQQTDIVVNHVALVERGRCGPRCAIGDHVYQPKTAKGKTAMPSKQRVVINTGGNPRRRVTLDTLRQRVADAEEDLKQAEQKAQDEGLEPDGDEGGATHIHIHTGGANPTVTDEAEDLDDGQQVPNEETKDGGDIETRMAALESTVAKLVDSVGQLLGGTDDGELPGEKPDDQQTMDEDDPTKKDDEKTMDEDIEEGDKTKTNDSAALQRGYTALLAKAEVLVPGFRMPTFDAKAKRKITVDSMCAARRKCLDMAYATKDGAPLIDQITGRTSLDLSKMGCADVAVLFNAASATKAAQNNASTRDSGQNLDTQAPVRKGPKTLAEINADNAAFWAKNTPRP